LDFPEETPRILAAAVQALRRLPQQGGLVV
jgi:hypothetical protein